MKSILCLLTVLVPALLWAQRQAVEPDCGAMLRQGELYEQRAELSKALQQYLSALNCDTRLAEVVGPKIQAVFQAIEAQRGREAQARRTAEQRSKEAEAEKRRAKSSELAARALLAYWRDRDATRSFRYAHYAYSYDTTNAEAVTVLYNLYFSQPSPRAVPSLPMYFNAPGDLWRDFRFFLALRGVDSAAVSPFAAFDASLGEDFPGHGPMPTGNFYSASKKYKAAALTTDSSTMVSFFRRMEGEYQLLDIPKVANGLVINVRFSDDERYLLVEEQAEETITTLYWLNDRLTGIPSPVRVMTISLPYELRVERHRNDLFVWVVNPLDPSATIYRLREDQPIYLKTIYGWVDTYGDYLSYREQNTNRRVIECFDYELVNVLTAEDLPYRFDFDGLPMAAAEPVEGERSVTSESRRFYLKTGEEKVVICDRQGRELVVYPRDAAGLCDQTFDWDYTPDERCAMLTGELYPSGSYGAGCPNGQIIRLWNDRLGLAYAFPREFMGLDEHDGGVIRFLDNRHLQVGGYRWMLDPKDIIRTYHDRGYWDLPVVEKQSLGIREEEMEWRVGGKSEVGSRKSEK